MSGHTASLQDSCVSPTMVATVSDQVQAAARRRETPEISTADVEAVINTVIALESGQGPKPATNTADYYDQIARFSGTSLYVVGQVVPAYIATLSGTQYDDAAKDTASQAKEAASASTGAQGTSAGTAAKSSKSGLFYAIGGLFGLIALIAIVAKRSQR